MIRVLRSVMRKITAVSRPLSLLWENMTTSAFRMNSMGRNWQKPAFPSALLNTKVWDMHFGNTPVNFRRRKTAQRRWPLWFGSSEYKINNSKQKEKGLDFRPFSFCLLFFCFVFSVLPFDRHYTQHQNDREENTRKDSRLDVFPHQVRYTSHNSRSGCAA